MVNVRFYANRAGTVLALFTLYSTRNPQS